MEVKEEAVGNSLEFLKVREEPIIDHSLKCQVKEEPVDYSIEFLEFEEEPVDNSLEFHQVKEEPVEVSGLQAAVNPVKINEAINEVCV